VAKLIVAKPPRIRPEPSGDGQDAEKPGGGGKVSLQPPLSQD
jgi:hypothetical protein